MRDPKRLSPWNDAYELHSHKEVVARDTEQASLARDGGKALCKINQYKVTKRLGKGAFGEVFLVKDTDGGASQYAMKVLHRSVLLRRRQGRFGSALDTVKVEIATMKRLDHPNCVHMFEVIQDPQHDEIFLVLEFVDGGPSQRVRKDGVGIPLKEAAIWSHLRHVVMGLEYLHMNGIVHRDIKPENLLLSRPVRGVQLLKIADYGTALLAEGAPGADAAQRTAGTPPFFSPETCDAARAGSFEPCVVDLWAIGVTIYMWLSGTPPFSAPAG